MEALKTLAIAAVVVACGFGLGQLAACGGSGGDGDGDTSVGTGWSGGTVGSGYIDPTPENMDGVPSKEFESDDIARANAASLLIRLYCDGAISEAQEVGCLSHVSIRDICQADTQGKNRALDEYEARVGNRNVCW